MSKAIATQRLGVIIAMVAQCLAVDYSAAQQPTPPKASSPKQATPPAGDAQLDANAKLLATQEWKQIYGEFQKWLASQAIYTPADVERINRNLAAQVRALPISELQGFVDDWKARLKVLKGENLQEAQEWLGQYLSVLNAGVRRQTLKNLGLTDVANMSARQIEDAFIRFHADRLARQQQQFAFDQLRHQRVQAVRQGNASIPPTGARVAGFGTNQSPYRPPKFNPPPPPRRQFLVDRDGQIAFVLPY